MSHFKTGIIKFTDYQGRTLNDYKISSIAQILNIFELTKVAYLLVIKNEKERTVQRFVKK